MASAATKARRVILTVSVTAITATGVWYGAGLKIRQEIKNDRVIHHDLAPAEQIERLERVRVGLLAQRTGLERKITELAERKAAREGPATSTSNGRT